METSGEGLILMGGPFRGRICLAQKRARLRIHECLQGCLYGLVDMIG